MIISAYLTRKNHLMVCQKPITGDLLKVELLGLAKVKSVHPTRMVVQYLDDDPKFLPELLYTIEPMVFKGRT